jgi:hypothetical protein
MAIDIEPYRHDLEVIRDTAQQVIRDFGLYGFQIQFTGNAHTAYSELHAQLVPALQQLEKSGRDQIRSLLYRIDIPERDFAQITVNQSKESFWSELAGLILRRELTKVITRKLFSPSNGL